jgi:hypothetical protein
MRCNAHEDIQASSSTALGAHLSWSCALAGMDAAQRKRRRTSIDAPLLRDPDFFDEAQLLDENLLDNGQDQRIALVPRWDRLRDKLVEWNPFNDYLVVNN